MSEAEGASQVPESIGPGPDVEMVEEGPGEDGENGGPSADTDATVQGSTSPQTTFLEYLKSPIVEILVGGGGGRAGDAESTLLTAHQAILTQSPFFADQLTDGSRNRVALPDETIDAVGCFLQYQYTGEYFPRRLPSIPDGLEADPSVPVVDDTGAQLLKHARVYTLAEKLGLPELKTLAHSKIHRINSTAVGEIAYARYVYGNTAKDDITIRRPVAAFWATRSHVLRHEAEEEFRAMCLEYPQFGFDVLSLVLYQREKRGRERELREEDGTTSGKGRKRPRPSVNV